MGKHYKDPKDKPSLLEHHYNPLTKLPAPHRTLTELCVSVVNSPADNEGGERALYAVIIPHNRVTDKEEHLRFYFSWHGAQAFIAKHNTKRVNKQNEGNMRLAKLLIYTMDEVKSYLASLTTPPEE
jgi:hypothetical protein